LTNTIVKMFGDNKTVENSGSNAKPGRVTNAEGKNNNLLRFGGLIATALFVLVGTACFFQSAGAGSQIVRKLGEVEGGAGMQQHWNSGGYGYGLGLMQRYVEGGAGKKEEEYVEGGKGGKGGKCEGKFFFIPEGGFQKIGEFPGVQVGVHDYKFIGTGTITGTTFNKYGTRSTAKVHGTGPPNVGYYAGTTNVTVYGPMYKWGAKPAEPGPGNKNAYGCEVDLAAGKKEHEPYFGIPIYYNWPKKIWIYRPEQGPPQFGPKRGVDGPWWERPEEPELVDGKVWTGWKPMPGYTVNHAYVKGEKFVPPVEGGAGR